MDCMEGTPENANVSHSPLDIPCSPCLAKKLIHVFNQTVNGQDIAQSWIITPSELSL